MLLLETTIVAAALLLLTAAPATTTRNSPASAPPAVCSDTRLLCQFRPAVNCSPAASAAAAEAGANASVATFRQDAPSYEPSSLQLQLPPSPPDGSRPLDSFDVANLDGLVSCFGLTYIVTLRMAVGSTQCRLLPGALGAFAAIKRLTLRLRFEGDRIPGGLFDETLANLENLQLESPRVTAIEPAAFNALRRLSRLFISNLKLHYLTASVLQGLERLRFLELPDNALARLDAASFAASPRLESADLRTTVGPAGPVAFAEDTFCGLTQLQQLLYSEGLGALNCSNFASRKLHLSLSRGSETIVTQCVRRLGESTPCRGSAGVPAATTSATASTTSMASSAKQTSQSVSQKSTKFVVSSTRPTSFPLSSTASTASTAVSSRSSKPSSPMSTTDPGQRASPDKQATANGGRGGVSAGAAAAVAVTVIALIVVATSVAVFIAKRRRHGVLHRAQSRQPIFSASLDMQESVWNPIFNVEAAPPAEPEASGTSSSTDSSAASGAGGGADNTESS